MFKNQEDIVVDEAELALLASVPAQHLQLSQTATDLEFLLRLMLQSDILIGDNLAGKQNQIYFYGCYYYFSYSSFYSIKFTSLQAF